MYYNTTNESGTGYKANLEQANNQNELTLAVFQTYPNESLSANDVWSFLIDNDSINEQTPLTSIRRAITDLTNQDKLLKTDKKVMGGSGRKTYTWRLNNV